MDYKQLLLQIHYSFCPEWWKILERIGGFRDSDAGSISSYAFSQQSSTETLIITIGDILVMVGRISGGNLDD